MVWTFGTEFSLHSITCEYYAVQCVSPKYYKAKFPISKTNAKKYNLQWVSQFMFWMAQYHKFFGYADKALGTCLWRLEET